MGGEFPVLPDRPRRRRPGMAFPRLRATGRWRSRPRSSRAPATIRRDAGEHRLLLGLRDASRSRDVPLRSGCIAPFTERTTHYAQNVYLVAPRKLEYRDYDLPPKVLATLR